MNTVGIDFGTTKTLVATLDERSGKPITIRLGRSGDEVPTTIHVDAERQFSFGEDADDLLTSDNKNYLPRIKRDLGTGREYVLNGHQFTSVDLVAEFLKHIRKRLELEHFHGKIDHAVITVPAKFGPAARNDLEAAAKRAQFVSFELLDEPVSAGIAFLDEKQESNLWEEILVFDWGGGTLDIALVENRNGAWNLNHDLLEGDPWLGGEDIDDSMIEAVNGSLLQAGQLAIEPNDQPDHSLLYRQVVIMKRMLSKKESHTLWLVASKCKISFPYTRKDFEEFISNELDRAFQCLTNWEQKARATGKMAENVLLVGGTSQIPAVSKRLATFGKKPFLWTNGMRAVALGAALHAGKKSGNSNTKTGNLQRYRDLLEGIIADGSVTEAEAAFGIQKRAALNITPSEADAIENQILGKSLAELVNSLASQSEEGLQPLLEIAFCVPEYGVFVQAIHREGFLARNDSLENTHFSFGSDILLTNCSRKPITNVSLSIIRNGQKERDLGTIARVLDPQERVRLTSIESEWIIESGDVIEYSCQDCSSPIQKTVQKKDCKVSKQPELPLAVTWTPASFSGKVLQLSCCEKIIHQVTVSSTSGVALLEKVSGDDWTAAGWIEFSDSRNLNDSEIVEVSAAGFCPTIVRIVV